MPSTQAFNQSETYKKICEYLEDRRNRDNQIESWAAKCNAKDKILDLVMDELGKSIYQNSDLIAFFDVVDDSDLSDFNNIEQK